MFADPDPHHEIGWIRILEWLGSEVEINTQIQNRPEIGINIQSYSCYMIFSFSPILIMKY